MFSSGSQSHIKAAPATAIINSQGSVEKHVKSDKEDVSLQAIEFVDAYGFEVLLGLDRDIYCDLKVNTNFEISDI